MIVSLFNVCVLYEFEGGSESCKVVYLKFLFINERY